MFVALLTSRRGSSEPRCPESPSSVLNTAFPVPLLNLVYRLAWDFPPLVKFLYKLGDCSATVRVCAAKVNVDLNLIWYLNFCLTRSYLPSFLQAAIARAPSFSLTAFCTCWEHRIPWLMGASNSAPVGRSYPWVSLSQPLFSSVVSAGRCKLSWRFSCFCKAVTTLIIA